MKPTERRTDDRVVARRPCRWRPARSAPPGRGGRCPSLRVRRRWRPPGRTAVSSWG